MKQEKFIKNLRKALFISGIIEKIMSINKGLKDAGEGLEEIEKSFKKDKKKQ